MIEEKSVLYSSKQRRLSPSMVTTHNYASTHHLNMDKPPEIGLKHCSTALEIAVLMQRATTCLSVRQLYHQNMQSLPTFVCACNDSVSPVALDRTHLPKRRPPSPWSSPSVSSYPLPLYCLPSKQPKLALAAAWSRNRRRWIREA